MTQDMLTPGVSWASANALSAAAPRLDSRSLVCIVWARGVRILGQSRFQPPWPQRGSDLRSRRLAFSSESAALRRKTTFRTRGVRILGQYCSAIRARTFAPIEDQRCRGSRPIHPRFDATRAFCPAERWPGRIDDGQEDGGLARLRDFGAARSGRGGLASWRVARGGT